MFGTTSTSVGLLLLVQNYLASLLCCLYFAAIELLRIPAFFGVRVQEFCWEVAMCGGYLALACRSYKNTCFRCILFAKPMDTGYH